MFNTNIWQTSEWVSEWVSDYFLTPIQQFFQLQCIWRREQVIFNEMMMIEVRFVLDQHTKLDFYSASSLKKQSACRHVVPLGHIILIPSKPVFALSP